MTTLWLTGDVSALLCTNSMISAQHQGCRLPNPPIHQPSHRWDYHFKGSDELLSGRSFSAAGFWWRQVSSVHQVCSAFNVLLLLLIFSSCTRRSEHQYFLLGWIGWIYSISIREGGESQPSDLWFSLMRGLYFHTVQLKYKSVIFSCQRVPEGEIIVTRFCQKRQNTKCGVHFQSALCVFWFVIDHSSFSPSKI